MKTAVSVRGDDRWRRAINHFPSFGQHYHVTLDAKRAIKDQQTVFHIVGSRVGVGLQDANAGFATFGHCRWQSYFDELCSIWRLSRCQARCLRVLARYRFKFEFGAGAAVQNPFFCGHGARTNGIQEELGAFAVLRYVIRDGELMAFRREQFIKRELVTGDDLYAQAAEKHQHCDSS